MFLDGYGLIVQQDGDGGDTLHREGMYAFGQWLRYHAESNTLFVTGLPQREEPSKIMDKFEVKPGIYVRHPDPSRWSSRPETTSRDQLVPVIAYCAAYRDHPRLWRLFKAVAKRGFFAQNIIKNGPGKNEIKVPDTMIAHMGLFIRAGGWYTIPLYPLLFVTDTVHLAGTLLALIPVHKSDGDFKLRWKEKRDVDDNNVIIAHLMAAYFKPTPISWLDRQIYSLTRRSNYGVTKLGEINRVMGALAWYHRTEAGGNPELAELYRPLIEKHFSARQTYQEGLNRLARVFSRGKRKVMVATR